MPNDYAVFLAVALRDVYNLQGKIHKLICAKHKPLCTLEWKKIICITFGKLILKFLHENPRKLYHLH